MEALIHNKLKAGCSFVWLYMETITLKYSHQCIGLSSKSSIRTSQHFCLTGWEAINLSEQANESNICWFTSEEGIQYSYLCFGHSRSTSPFIPLHSISNLFGNSWPEIHHGWLLFLENRVRWWHNFSTRWHIKSWHFKKGLYLPTLGAIQHG